MSEPRNCDEAGRLRSSPSHGSSAPARGQLFAGRTAHQPAGILRPLGATGAATTTSALEFLRSRVERPRFCSPGQEPLALPDVEDVRIHVLGPPRDDRIKKSDPTRRGQEVYELALDMQGVDDVPRRGHDRNQGEG